MATIELVNLPADGQRFHGAELDNIGVALNTGGVVENSLSATVTGSDLVVTVPTITDARVPDGSGGITLVTKAGAGLTHDTNAGNSPRIDLGTLDVNGNHEIVKGTPTAETGTRKEAPEPALPTDAILLYKARFESGATTVATDKVWGRAIKVQPAVPGFAFAGSQTTEGTISNGSAGDVVTVTLTTSIAATTPFLIMGNWRKAGTAAVAYLGLTVNSTIVAEAAASVNAFGLTDTASDVGSGAFCIYIGPRVTNYLRGAASMFGISAAIAAGAAGPLRLQTADIPTATVTAITIRGISHASDTLGVTEVFVFALPTAS